MLDEKTKLVSSDAEAAATSGYGANDGVVNSFLLGASRTDPQERPRDSTNAGGHSEEGNGRRQSNEGSRQAASDNDNANDGDNDDGYVTLHDALVNSDLSIADWDVNEEITEIIEVIVEYGKLGVVPFAIIIFYNVSGGPFGIESSVRAGGFLPSILGFAILPFFWSIQEALMTAELGTAIPDSAGGVAWVEEAFGTKAAFLAGYLGWIAGATDNAIYPVLFMEYLLQAFVAPSADDDGADASSDEMGLINPWLRFAALSAVSIGLGYVNWLGLPIVGDMSMTICFIGMSPFIILTLVGMFKIDPSRWMEMPAAYDLSNMDAVDDDSYNVAGGLFSGAVWGGIMWRPFLNNIFWNLNSFDAGGSFVEDIDDPSRVLPRAMQWSVFMVAICYLIPLMIAIGASDSDNTEWVDGYLARLASDVVGPWLGIWTVFAAAISNIGMFQAELSADALQLKGMADHGYVPKIFSRRSRQGTPTYSIALGVAIIVMLGAAKLDQLVEMLNFNYSISLLMEYAAFLKLRFTRPDMERPYQIPLNNFWCCVFMMPAILLTVFLMLLATYTTLAFAVVVNIIGFAMFYCRSKKGTRVMGRKASKSMMNGSVGSGDQSRSASITQET
mmetsp:Transcript_4442/g.12771  ORF Transcript_4442/g.12771 Transcript_4442/m.12771 type:complete len:615 (-) Transcript_4442:106-1950(-)